MRVVAVVEAVMVVLSAAGDLGMEFSLVRVFVG
jgi:hypothetical protein